MSERVERRLYDLLGKPTESPYGNPIPGLEALGGEAVVQPLTPYRDLLSAVAQVSAGQPMLLERLAEPIQVDPELLTQLDEAGLRPGATITAEEVGGYISVRVPGIEGALELPAEVASHVFISAPAS